MYIFSPDLILELGDGQLYWLSLWQFKVSMFKPDLVIDLSFHSVNTYLIKYYI